MATLELSLASAVMRLLDVQSALTAQRDMLLQLLRQQHGQPPLALPAQPAVALPPPPQLQPSAFALAAPPLQHSAFALAATQLRQPSPPPLHSVFAAHAGGPQQAQQPLPGVPQQAQQPRSPMDETE